MTDAVRPAVRASRAGARRRRAARRRRRRSRRVRARVTELTAGDPRRCSRRASPRSGSRARSRTAGSGTPATCYFTLKDAGAQIKAVMFRSALRYLKFKPEDGLHVVARGRAQRLRAEGRVPARLRAPGAARARRAAARLRAAEEAAAGRGAVRRGAQAAAARAAPQDRHRHLARRRRLRDIIKVLRRRYPNAHLVIRPTRVQGEGAAARHRPRRSRPIARVPGVDVVIVGRGGGSIEDLWAFNEEVVARAIAACAGAGHLGGRPRDRRHDRRLRRRPARAHAVGGRRDGRRRARTSSAPASTGSPARLRGAVARRVERLPPRVHRLARPAGARRLPRPARAARPPRRPS